jgi:hypothetical protein
MTYLEQRLATLLKAIAAARAAGPSPLLAVLLKKKEVICAALAAPEHCLDPECAPGTAPAKSGRGRAAAPSPTRVSEACET